MPSTFSGQKIVVVGGTSGIGFATAKFSLLNHAAHVVIASSKKVRVDDAVIRLRAIVNEGKVLGTVEGFVVEASNVEEVKDLMRKVGEIDHLVWTPTGIIDSSAGFKDLNLKSKSHLFDVRFWGFAAAAQAVNIRTGGSITHTIGTIYQRPSSGWALMCGVAGSVDGLTRGLAVDLAPVRVNTICLGIVNTELWKALPAELAKNRLAESAQKLLVKHVADADEVADAYLFCMKCKYVTGQTIVVDGGVLLV